MSADQGKRKCVSSVVVSRFGWMGAMTVAVTRRLALLVPILVLHERIIALCESA